MTEERGIDWDQGSLDNGEHLNVRGAEMLSRYFGSYLKQNYELEDHRGEAEYQSFDDMVAQYQKARKNAAKKIEVILKYLREKK